MKIEYAIILASATLVLGYKPEPQPEPPKKCTDMVCVNGKYIMRHVPYFRETTKKNQLTIM
jgi:hypothetical protein